MSLLTSLIDSEAIIEFLCLQYRPNPQPLPYKGRGVKFKASLLLGYGVYTSRKILYSHFCQSETVTLTDIPP
ncbi:hypothetical protein COO91_05489 [Nostoc flagelliforme CCNUN1]|uniref:Uncharacterized protein n=1 Tax=Nostoc flagelliforme CCNUN1 TaxID=2038116 RepID=A0A2K8SXL6_9NOSO|nr:hypothetical protein COO91_05489 [Nostoc flagelliforme CCNUN1]